MKRTLLPLLLSATVFMAFPAFSEEEKTSADGSKDYTIIKIGSDEIKNSEVLDTWKSLFPAGAAPDFSGFDENIRQNVLRGLISERLVYAEALKAGVDKDADVKKRLVMLERQLIMQNFMENKAKSLVSDDQLKAAYEAKVTASKGQEEVKARHILVSSEDDAKKIAADLKKGGDFDKVAKEKSTDKASGAKGGDLGWFTKDRMVPAFAEAAFKMKKGDISAPVKSEFGWHIIKLEDRRAVQVQSFEDMKENLKGEVTNKAVESYVEGLLKTASVKYLDADGKEKPFSTVAPAKVDDKSAEKK